MAGKKGKKKGKKTGKKSKSYGDYYKPDADSIRNADSSSSYSYISSVSTVEDLAQHYNKFQKSEKKKAKELLVMQKAELDSELWEARYTALEQTKNDFRANAQELSLENELLLNQMRETESDTIDVVTYLKKEDQRKDVKIDSLQAELKFIKRNHRLEKQKMIDDHNHKIFSLEKLIAKKQEDIKLMQHELQHVKEFRKKRALMQKELDEIRDTMFLSNREHKEETSRLEQKFLEERISLRKEADQKIGELAVRAHQEALTNLDETTRTVHKENTSLAEQLSQLIKEEEALRRYNSKLRDENNLLLAEADNSQALLKEKAHDNQKKASKLQELDGKVNLLERALNHMIREFTSERKQLLDSCDLSHENSRRQIVLLQKDVDAKTKECSRVRKLAKRILQERNEVEVFFLDSLELVRHQIQINQEEYKKAATKAYNRRMVEAFAGQNDYPKVRTFNKSDTSTNNVFRDLQAAEMLSRTTGQLDLTDLTWEQREKVLRYLFARMNGTTKPPSGLPPSQNEESDSREHLEAPAQQLPITHDGQTAGYIDADPYYDNRNENSKQLNRFSVLPDITQHQAIGLPITAA